MRLAGGPEFRVSARHPPPRSHTGEYQVRAATGSLGHPLRHRVEDPRPRLGQRHLAGEGQPTLVRGGTGRRLGSPGRDDYVHLAASGRLRFGALQRALGGRAEGPAGVDTRCPQGGAARDHRAPQHLLRQPGVVPNFHGQSVLGAPAEAGGAHQNYRHFPRLALHIAAPAKTRGARGKAAIHCGFCG